MVKASKSIAWWHMAVQLSQLMKIKKNSPQLYIKKKEDIYLTSLLLCQSELQPSQDVVTFTGGKGTNQQQVSQRWLIPEQCCRLFFSNQSKLTMIMAPLLLAAAASNCSSGFCRVEFQNKFYSGQGFKFLPFTFESILDGRFEEWQPRPMTRLVSCVCVLLNSDCCVRVRACVSVWNAVSDLLRCHHWKDCFFCCCWSNLKSHF